MINALYIPRQSGTYTDLLVALGLATLAEYALQATQQKKHIQLFHEGTRYRLQFQQSVDIDAIASLKYVNLFPPICGSKTKLSPEGRAIAFDTVEETDVRKRYRTPAKGKQEENAPEPPDPRVQNGVILTSMRHDRNHNDLWEQGCQLREHFGSLVAAIFREFGTQENLHQGSQCDRISKHFQKQTGGAKLPGDGSAVKIYFPTSVQGVSRVKADSNQASASAKEPWLRLWLCAKGFFEFALSERIKLSDNSYDWRVVVLEPYEISLNDYRSVLNRLRKFNPPSGSHGIARFDAELALLLSQKLLDYSPINLYRSSQKAAKVRGFTGTHFVSKGQVYGVKEVFSLGLPDWLNPRSRREILDYHKVLSEHLAISRSLAAEEGNSELLSAYRDFITGNDLRLFFPFQARYADYVVSRLNQYAAKHQSDSRLRPPRLLSVSGLDLMSKQDIDFLKIVRNDSFLRIAKAINQATVYAGEVINNKAGGGIEIIKLDWPRTYGLAQRLSSQASSRQDFLREVADFIAKYEAENLRLAEDLKKNGKLLKRVWLTSKDLDGFVELVNEFDSSLVANLLIAYGYAKWTSSKKTGSEQPEDSNPEVENTDNE